MAEFTHFAMAAAEEALHDSGCLPLTDQEKESTVWVSMAINSFSASKLI